MESVDPANVNKGFNKPEEYAGVQRLGNVYAITSFIFAWIMTRPVSPSGRYSRLTHTASGLPIFGC